LENSSPFLQKKDGAGRRRNEKELAMVATTDELGGYASLPSQGMT
jgi:hypothetical protein